MFGLYSKLGFSGGERRKLVVSSSKPLPNRNQIDCMDAGLRSAAGAQEIVNMITSRPSVTKLILAHNFLSDDGCTVLFQFLRSSVGRKYRITVISLNSNGIGDRGLMAIALYLVDNTNLKELFLQSNRFTCNPNTIRSFTKALNTSRLRLLSMTTNPSLSDTFTQVFFSELDSPTLGELHLSAVGITRHSAPCMADFISSSRCRFHTFKCNGNTLGYRGVRSIIRAIDTNNFTLLRVELHSNQIAVNPNDQGSDNTEDEDDERAIGPDAWKSGETQLKRVLARNAHMKRVVEREALELLTYARILLLRSKNAMESETPEQSTSISGFRYTALPIELQLHILKFLAPTLSAAQRVAIFTYASSPSTLPSLLPSLKTPDVSCIPSPSVVNDGLSSPRQTVWSINPGSSSTSGQCMGSGSLFCQREQERAKWLETVACMAFDPEVAQEN